jgi:radical SAM protein with 4Fe4S-binding SPASM domain
MYNSPSYIKQCENSLSPKYIYKLLDEFASILKEYNIRGSLALTGGDPILSPYFWDVLEYIKDNYNDLFRIAIMGNPYHIYESDAIRLKKLNVSDYQISIDGMEEIHDTIRKAGSFKDSLRALKAIHTAGINAGVAFTVSRMNVSELIPLMNYLDTLDFVDWFGFDRLTPMGNASDQQNDLLSPIEYREVLYSVFLREIFNDKRSIFRKEKLWKLLFYQLGLVNPFDYTTKKICTGCEASTSALAVLADGTIYACRRLEIPIGKFPEQNLWDVLLNNDLGKKIRNLDNYDNCSNCELLSYCRGCLATKFAVSGNLYAEDPYCWRFIKNV